MAARDKITVDLYQVLAHAASNSDDVDLMAEHLTQLLAGSMDLLACTIFLLNEESGELERLKSFGLSVPYMNKGRVFAGRSGGPIINEPIIIPDVRDTDLLQYPEATIAEGIGAIVTVPIKHRDKLIGSIRLYHHKPWQISEPDLQALVVFGEIVGMAMTHVRLLNTLWSIRHIVERTGQIA
jgi:GAF domain-containing protein